MLVRVQEVLADGNNNRRIPFPASRDKQKQTKQQEAEQDEADARADLRDILSRDEIKRNAFRIQKAKEREKLEVPCLLSACEHTHRESAESSKHAALKLFNSSPRVLCRVFCLQRV